YLKGCRIIVGCSAFDPKNELLRLAKVDHAASFGFAVVGVDRYLRQRFETFCEKDVDVAVEILRNDVHEHVSLISQESIKVAREERVADVPRANAAVYLVLIERCGVTDVSGLPGSERGR